MRGGPLGEGGSGQRDPFLGCSQLCAVCCAPLSLSLSRCEGFSKAAGLHNGTSREFVIIPVAEQEREREMQLLSLARSLISNPAHTHINSEGKSRERVRPGCVGCSLFSLLESCCWCAPGNLFFRNNNSTSHHPAARLNSFSAAPPFDCLRRNSLAGTHARKMERLCSSSEGANKKNTAASERGRREFLCSSSSSTHKINGFLLMLRRARSRTRNHGNHKYINCRNRNELVREREREEREREREYTVHRSSFLEIAVMPPTRKKHFIENEALAQNTSLSLLYATAFVVWLLALKLLDAAFGPLLLRLVFN